MSKSDKKTGSKTLIFEDTEIYENIHEARYYGAVVAMFGLTPHTQMQHMLPAGYKDRWIKLQKDKEEELKLKNQKLSDLKDPFADPIQIVFLFYFFLFFFSFLSQQTSKRKEQKPQII